VLKPAIACGIALAVRCVVHDQSKRKRRRKIARYWSQLKIGKPGVYIRRCDFGNAPVRKIAAESAQTKPEAVVNLHVDYP